MSIGAESEAQEFISGKLAQVNVAQIEKQLNELWKQAAHGDPESGNSAVVRACSFNLVLVTDAADAETKCTDLLDEIESGHPCRAILSVFRPSRQHELNAWVSARCHTLGASKQICSEQITVVCDGGKPEELGSVVLPLILPDLPVFIWWREGRIHWEELHALHGCARRFILDSGRNAFDPSIFSDAERLIKQNANCLYVSDINWRRLHGWCRAIADSFDGFPMPVELLDKINKVTMTFTGDSQASNRTLLLTGWLAGRLGWEPVSMSAACTEARFKSKSGQQVDVIFAADKASTSRGHLLEVKIEFAGDARKLLITPERTDEARFINSRLEGSEENEATRVSNILSEAVLVGQELEVLSNDPVYEASTLMVSRMLTMRK